MGLRRLDAIRAFVIIAWLWAVPAVAGAQRSIVHAGAGTHASSSRPLPGIGLTPLPSDLRTIVVSQRAAEADERLIVQLKSPPIAISRRQGGDVEAPAREHQRVLAALARLAPTGFDPTRPSVVRRRFMFAFNGMAVRVPRGMIDRIRRLPDVAGVLPDDTVRATLSQSVPLIRADVLHTQGATGAGVRVGVIDTGIDYTHPALGGGFGPAHRVVAGYDYVNDDADPMDDHGHGTHVAGIVGANGGGLTGVAPGVTFHAYKVLGAGGSGLTSDVVAAIDRAVDPDQNPFTNDGVDVINLSLGAPGDADDPMSQAVDNAVQAGVVCVASAGNDGLHLSIGSPGTARRAITVGSSTKTDAMAPGSSRGPNYPDYDLKPDLVAPGEGIVSSWLGGSSLPLSGTSMAAPHVTGSAALLLQLHSSWSPERIKAALMNAAVDLGQEPFTQGTGRLDVAAASAPGFVISPASVSFGLAVAAQPVWSAEHIVTVTNVSASFQTVTLTVSGSLPAGASFVLNNGSVGLAPGQSHPVVVTLTVDRSAVPDLLVPPHAYTAALVATAGATQHRVPLTFLKVPQLVIELDETFVMLNIYDRATFAVNGHNVTPRVRLLVPPATYDVIAGFVPAPYDAYVFEEGIVVTDSAGIQITRTEAVHTIDLETLDENGSPVECRSGSDVFVHRPSGFRLIQVFVRGTVMQFSPVSASYLWGWTGASHVSRPRFYTFAGSQIGVSGSATITTDPGSFHHETYQYRVESGTDSIRLAHYVTDGPSGHADPVFGSGVFWAGVTELTEPLEPPFAQEVYALEHIGTAETGELFSTYKQVFVAEDPEAFDWSQPRLQSPYAFRMPSGSLDGMLQGAGLRMFSVSNGQMRLGHGPPYWFGRMTNQLGSMVLTSVSGPLFWLYLSQQGDWRPHEGLPYTLKQGGSVVESGIIAQAGGRTSSGIFVRSIAPGAYTLEVPYDGYELHGEPAHAVATLSFNTTLADRNPPHILNLTVLGGGTPSDVLQSGTGQPKTVRVRLREDRKLRSAALAYRLAPTDPWTPMTVTQSADTFFAAVPTDIVGMVSLLLFADDTTGNSLTYTVEPAFLVSDVVAAPGPPATRPGRLLLHGPAPNPSFGTLRLSFTLPHGAPATLEVVDLAGRIVATREVGGFGPGRHSVDFGDRSWAPGIYLGRLRQGTEWRTIKACVLR